MSDTYIRHGNHWRKAQRRALVLQKASNRRKKRDRARRKRRKAGRPPNAVENRGTKKGTAGSTS
jgi:hypothetical protein